MAENRMKDPHDHSSNAGSPGASGPGEPGYEGEVTVGDEGAADVVHQLQAGDSPEVEEGWEQAKSMEGQAPSG